MVEVLSVLATLLGSSTGVIKSFSCTNSVFSGECLFSVFALTGVILCLGSIISYFVSSILLSLIELLNILAGGSPNTILSDLGKNFF